MAATNRPDVLDPALLRPGRFDRRVTVDMPDIKDREEILAVHAKGKPFAKDVAIRRLAERTPGSLVLISRTFSMKRQFSPCAVVKKLVKLKFSKVLKKLFLVQSARVG